MEGFLGALLFLVFFAGFMRVDGNVAKISETLQRIEKELVESNKEKK